MNFAKFLRTPFFTENLRWLLLYQALFMNVKILLFSFPKPSTLLGNIRSCRRSYSSTEHLQTTASGSKMLFDIILFDTKYFYFEEVFVLIVFVVDCIHYRSSHRRCSVRKGVLRSFVKFTGKHLCQSIFFSDQYFLV